MFLKNYTSEVPVSQTIYRIEQVLIKCRVTGITKEYNPQGQVAAIIFQFPGPTGQELTVRLPADKEKALEALWLNYADGEKLSADGQRLAYSPYKKKKRSDFAQQAERTAWKIVQDWVEVQMSMIQMNQADQLEVFLPYIWDGERTIYRKIKDSNFRALLPEKTDDLCLAQ